METTAKGSLPDYSSPVINFSQEIVDLVRADLKSFEFSQTLETESWKSGLPEPLNTMENYPALRALLRQRGTNHFWTVISALMGVSFIIFDHRPVLTAEEILIIKNDYPDLIDNLNPKIIPGYILRASGRSVNLINNINPLLINNGDPDLISNINPPDGIKDRFFYVYIFYNKAADEITQTEVAEIREKVRNIVMYFAPVGREISEMVNIFS
jgi:hypothetical protein